MSGDDTQDPGRGDRQRITDLKLDERSILRRNPDIEHERRVAIFDLIEDNLFVPATRYPSEYIGPFHVLLRMEDNRLAIDIKTIDSEPLETVVLPLTPFRRVIKEYFLICDSYFKAIKSSSPRQIEAIDMGRRGIHNEGSDILRERLADRITIDTDTARRLFTLLCVLQIRM